MHSVVCCVAQEASMAHYEYTEQWYHFYYNRCCDYSNYKPSLHGGCSGNSCFGVASSYGSAL